MKNNLNEENKFDEDTKNTFVDFFQSSTVLLNQQSKETKV